MKCDDSHQFSEGSVVCLFLSIETSWVIHGSLEIIPNSGIMVTEFDHFLASEEYDLLCYSSRVRSYSQVNARKTFPDVP